MENKAVVAKGEEQGLDKDGFSVRWTLENGLGLVFVVSTSFGSNLGQPLTRP